MKTGTLISREVFTSSGSTVVPAGASKCVALVINGGNGGDGGDQAGTSRSGYGNMYGGLGGHGAFPIMKSFKDLIVGASITATVGAGGVGGAGGSGATGSEYASGGIGTVGGTSSVSGAIALTGISQTEYSDYDIKYDSVLPCAGGERANSSGSDGFGGGGCNVTIDANYDISIGIQEIMLGSDRYVGVAGGGNGGLSENTRGYGGGSTTKSCAGGGAGGVGGYSGSNSGTNGGNAILYGGGGSGGGGANHDDNTLGDGLTGGNGGNGSSGIVILWFYS